MLYSYGLTTFQAQGLGTSYSFCDTCMQVLSLKFDQTSFLKNNEYNNGYAQGYTGIGFFMKPTLQYYFTPRTRVNFGIYLLKYSGINQFTQSIPAFTVTHRLSKAVDIIMGNINGTLFHQLEEPIYRFDQYYRQNMEYGLQVLVHPSGFYMDTWLDWKRFIFKNDPFQELLQWGTRMNIDLFRSDDFQMRLPIQWLMYHRGGQIDLSPDPILTVFNGGAGLDLVYDLKPNHSLSISPFFFIFRELSLVETGTSQLKFGRGNAMYLKLKYEQPKIEAMLGYWRGYQFLAPYGEFLFQSASEFDPNISQKNRQLLTGKFYYKYKPSSSIRLELRLDAYYDIIKRVQDHAVSLFIVIDDDFFITQIKKQERHSEQ